MASKRTIFEDGRYPEFVERYHADPLRFAVEVCGLIPSRDQIDLFNAMIPKTARVSVVSGTGTGKSFAFARIALWHLLCHPVCEYEGKQEIGSNTYIGAPAIAQVSQGIWKEAQDARIAIGNGPCAWLLDYFTIAKTKIYVNGFDDQWFIAQVALAPGDSVAIAGKHREMQLVIVDEAAGVQDSHFDVINGTQTQSMNRTLLASQGARASGFFWSTHHHLSKENGGVWTALTFSSKNSPFTSRDWLRERLHETGGEQSAEYQIRVLGRFPEQMDKYLLGASSIDAVIGADRTIRDDEPYGNVLSVDVAAGVYRDKSVCAHFHVIDYGDRIDEDPRRADLIAVPVYSSSLDWDGLARQVMDYAMRLSNPTVLVDTGGQGVQFAKKLEKMGLPNVVHVNWGAPCFKRRNKERFFNQRAQCNVHLAEAIRDARVSLEPSLRKEFLAQGTRIPFGFNERAQYKLHSKEDMRKEGIHSPDLWDVVAQVFLEGASYMVADSDSLKATDLSSAVAGKADQLFADL